MQVLNTLGVLICVLFACQPAIALNADDHGMASTANGGHLDRLVRFRQLPCPHASEPAATGSNFVDLTIVYVRVILDVFDRVSYRQSAVKAQVRLDKVLAPDPRLLVGQPGCPSTDDGLHCAPTDQHNDIVALVDEREATTASIAAAVHFQAKMDPKHSSSMSATAIASLAIKAASLFIDMANAIV